VGAVIASVLALATAQPMYLLFTVDGHRVRADRTVVLRQGQVLGWARTVSAFTLKRLECKPAVVHRIRLSQTHRWRVPDLAEGAYSMSGRGANFTFDYIVRVKNHAAPCPG
jgi:hypothetical protein